MRGFVRFGAAICIAALLHSTISESRAQVATCNTAALEPMFANVAFNFVEPMGESRRLRRPLIGNGFIIHARRGRICGEYREAAGSACVPAGRPASRRTPMPRRLWEVTVVTAAHVVEHVCRWEEGGVRPATRMTLHPGPSSIRWDAWNESLEFRSGFFHEIELDNAWCAANADAEDQIPDRAGDPEPDVWVFRVLVAIPERQVITPYAIGSYDSLSAGGDVEIFGFDFIRLDETSSSQLPQSASYQGPTDEERLLYQPLPVGMINTATLGNSPLRKIGVQNVYGGRSGSPVVRIGDDHIPRVLGVLVRHGRTPPNIATVCPPGQCNQLRDEAAAIGETEAYMTPLLRASTMLLLPSLGVVNGESLVDIAPEAAQRRSWLGSGQAQPELQLADGDADDAGWRVAAAVRLYREWQENGDNSSYEVAFERALGQLGPLEQIAMWQGLASSGVYSDDPLIREAADGCLPRNAPQQILPRRPG